MGVEPISGLSEAVGATHCSLKGAAIPFRNGMRGARETFLESFEPRKPLNTHLW